MTFTSLAVTNLLRHRTRSILTLAGIAASVAVLFSILSFNRGFEIGLSRELQNTGVHFMVVPSGCPHEVASLVLHGAVIPKYLDLGVLDAIRGIKGVELASPLLVAQIPNIKDNRIDLAYGLQMEYLQKIKPQWKIEGTAPLADNEVLVGGEIASHYGLRPGGTLNYGKDNREFRITGILSKTGGQDDAFLYMPISALQGLLNKKGGATAVGVRISDPSELTSITDELSTRVPGIQIVTINQVMTSLRSLAASAKVLSLSVAIIAILISTVGVMNSVLMTVFERIQEIGMMRAIGASRLDIFRVTVKETIILTSAGGVLGILIAVIGSGLIEGFARHTMPFVPSGKMISFDPWLAAICLGFALITGILAGLYPAWRAARVAPIEAIKG